MWSGDVRYPRVASVNSLGARAVCSRVLVFRMVPSCPVGVGVVSVVMWEDYGHGVYLGVVVVRDVPGGVLHGTAVTLSWHA